MLNETSLALDKSRALFSARFILLVGTALVAPLIHQQMITGSIVNATLFVAATLLGIRMGILVGIVPSVIALAVGTLPPVLVPMVPYIMISNAILIVTFGFFKNRGYWIAVALASFFKFIFLFTASSVIIELFVKKELAQNVAIMMSWPQLLTAFVGGLIAYSYLHFYQAKFRRCS